MTTAKKIPMRQCMGCREMKSKKELLRVIRTPEGQILTDSTGRQNGRGAYLCRSRDCFLKARKSRALERALKTEIPEEVFQELEKEFETIEDNR